MARRNRHPDSQRRSIASPLAAVGLLAGLAVGIPLYKNWDRGNVAPETAIAASRGTIDADSPIERLLVQGAEAVSPSMTGEMDAPVPDSGLSSAEEVAAALAESEGSGAEAGSVGATIAPDAPRVEVDDAGEIVISAAAEDLAAPGDTDPAQLGADAEPEVPVSADDGEGADDADAQFLTESPSAVDAADQVLVAPPETVGTIGNGAFDVALSEVGAESTSLPEFAPAPELPGLEELTADAQVSDDFSVATSEPGLEAPPTLDEPELAPTEDIAQMAEISQDAATATAVDVQVGSAGVPFPRRKPDLIAYSVAQQIAEIETDPLPALQPEAPDPLGESVPDAGIAEAEEAENLLAFVLPRRSPLAVTDALATESATPQAELAGPAAVARIAVVVTALGFNEADTKRAIENLPEEIALAFAPIGQFSDPLALEATAKGHLVLAEVPMEPVNPARDPGEPLTLRVTNGPDENLRRLDEALAAVPGNSGISTYLGARFTRSVESAAPVVRALAARQLMLFENQPAPQSALQRLARDFGARYASGVTALDQVRDEAAIIAALDALEREAGQDGQPRVAIAAGYRETISALEKWSSEATRRGVRLIRLSDL